MGAMSRWSKGRVLGKDEGEWVEMRRGDGYEGKWRSRKSNTLHYTVFSPGPGQPTCFRGELALVSHSPQHDTRWGLLRVPCWWRNPIHPGKLWQVHLGLHHRGLMELAEASCRQGTGILFAADQAVLGNPAAPGCV